MNKEIYECTICADIYGETEEVTLAMLKRDFPSYRLEETAPLCPGCYNRSLKRLKEISKRCEKCGRVKLRAEERFHVWVDLDAGIAIEDSFRKHACRPKKKYAASPLLRTLYLLDLAAQRVQEDVDSKIWEILIGDGK